MGRGKAIPLTTTKIDSAPVGNLWDSRQPGLLVITNKRRRQTFKVRYDLDGKQRFKTFSPDYPMLTLDKARAMAAEIRVKAKDGAPAIIEGEITVDMVADIFLKSPRYPLSTRSKRYKQQWHRRFLRAFHPVIGHLDPGQVPQQVLIDIIENVIDEGKMAESQLLQAWCGTFYSNLGFHRNYKGENKVLNPIQGEKFTPYKSPDKIPLTEEEIKNFYLDHPQYNAIYQLLLLTGQRVGRVSILRWDSIKDGIWIVGEKGEMKNKRTAHHLPWLDEFEELIKPFRGNDSEFVFTHNGKQPLSHTAVSNALQKYNPDWTPHIFRHTFASHLEKVAHPYDVPLILHHSADAQRQNTSESTYMHSQQLDRKRIALQSWVDWIFQLRCGYEAYPEAQDWAIKNGQERGDFDIPPDPLDDLLKRLSDEDRAILAAVIPKEKIVNPAQQARTFQRTSIETDFDYLTESQGMTSTDALDQLSKKYHLPVAVLSDKGTLLGSAY